MNIRYPIYEGVYRILTLYISLLEKLFQESLPVGIGRDVL